MAAASFIVGIVGNVISILVFASPISTFWRIVKNKSTEDFGWLPYSATLLNTSLWSIYGLFKPGGLLILTVNGTGTILEAIYIILFFIYATKETKLKIIKLVAAVNVGFLALVILVAILLLHGSIRLLVVGVLCAALTIGMYASPMAAMAIVVKTKSVEYMPFSLSFFLFLNGGIWSTYSILVRDFFIGVPNAIGFALGTVQLIIYFLYLRKSLPEKERQRDEEQGSSHLRGTVEMIPKNHLVKGSSLPKQALARENSFVKIAKAFSMPPLELQSFRDQRDFAEENGEQNACIL